MYKAVHAQSGQEIIILSRLWAGQADFLRELGQGDRLVCPGCRRPVQARLGDVRVWHFAHKHLDNCPFASESLELLHARAVLYAWLVEQAGEEEVEIEVPLTERLAHPLDCWLKSSQTGFWIFDRRMPPDEREMLADAAASQRRMNWLFTASMLNGEPGRPDLLYLTTTEREFLNSSTYDQAWHKVTGEAGQTLHYLDGAAGRLVTYRDLRLHHPPQCFVGQRLENSLQDVRLADGEPVHPGEEQQRTWRRQALDLARQKEESRLARAQEKLQRLTGSAYAPQPAREQPVNAAPQPREELPAAAAPFNRMGACRRCGKVTGDWVAWFGQTNECLCRACADLED